MEPAAEVVGAGMGGDSILVEALVKGAAKGVNFLTMEQPLEKILKDHKNALWTETVKVLQITLKYKHAGMEEAVLGFYRSSLHE